MIRTSRFVLPMLAPVIASCAAVSGAGHILTDDARASTAVKSCCAALADLAAEDSLPTDVLSLTSQSSHFAFPTGMAPFATYRLPDSVAARVVVVISHMRQRGWIEGGDGNAHYANSQALFLDGERRLLETVLLSEGQVATTDGRALQRRFAVPSKAQYVVVTTDARRNGATESSRIEGQRDLPLVAGRHVFFLPGGLLPVEYRLATYGPVSIQLIANTQPKQ